MWNRGLEIRQRSVPWDLNTSEHRHCFGEVDKFYFTCESPVEITYASEPGSGQVCELRLKRHIPGDTLSRTSNPFPHGVEWG
jgi:hypothetical protein